MTIRAHHRRAMTSALIGAMLSGVTLTPSAASTVAKNATPRAVESRVSLRAPRVENIGVPLADLVRAKVIAVRPTVTRTPKSIRVTVGSTATFLARATGRPAPREQWYRAARASTRFIPVKGATGTSFVLRHVTLKLSGERFRAVFTNIAGRVTSRIATLVVKAPRPTKKPTPKKPKPVTTTSTTTVPVTTTTSTPVTTTTSAPVTIPAPAPASAPPSAPVTTTTSAPVTTTTSAPLLGPVVSLNPLNLSVASGGTVSFSAAASGTPAPSVAWWYSTDAGATYAQVTGASSSTLTLGVASLSWSGRLYKAIFTNSVGTATTTSATLTVTMAAALSSTNWAGYVASPGTYTSVTGTFSVPQANCTSGATTYAAAWVGIDGYLSATVEQDGVSIDCSGGVASYGAWYEMVGDTSPQCNCNAAVAIGSSYPVAPGDVITASVSYAPSQWTLSLVDTSASPNWTFSINIPTPSPAPTQASAEWIFERPLVCTTTACTSTTLSTLTTTTPVAFSAAGASAAGVTGTVSDFPGLPVIMATGTTILASPGPLSTDGSSFSVQE